MTALPFLTATLAFLLLGMATDQHHGKRLRRPCPKGRARVLRSAAWSLIALDLPLAIQQGGAVFGPIGWVGALMIGAALAFAVLNFVPLRRPFVAHA